MSRTPEDVLDALRQGGVLPVYWRRTARNRDRVPWHRGFRWTSTVVVASCGAVAGADGNRVRYSEIDEPWPEPHCYRCEHSTPGSDAAREGLDVNEYAREGLSSQRPKRRSKSPRRSTVAPRSGAD